jgi:alkaline phosphatase
MKLIRPAVSTPTIIKAHGTTKEYNYLVTNCKYRQHKNKNGAIIYFVTDGMGRWEDRVKFGQKDIV